MALTALWAKELQGTNILVNDYSPGWMQPDIGGANAPFTANEGAETAVYLATLPEGRKASFLQKCGWLLC